VTTEEIVDYLVSSECSAIIERDALLINSPGVNSTMMACLLPALTYEINPPSTCGVNPSCFVYSKKKRFDWGEENGPSYKIRSACGLVLGQTVRVKIAYLFILFVEHRYRIKIGATQLPRVPSGG